VQTLRAAGRDAPMDNGFTTPLGIFDRMTFDSKFSYYPKGWNGMPRATACVQTWDSTGGYSSTCANGR